MGREPCGVREGAGFAGGSAPSGTRAVAPHVFSGLKFAVAHVAIFRKGWFVPQRCFGRRRILSRIRRDASHPTARLPSGGSPCSARPSSGRFPTRYELSGRMPCGNVRVQERLWQVLPADAASRAEVAVRVEVPSSHRCAPAARAGSGRDTQPLCGPHRQREAGMQTCEGKGLGNFGRAPCLGAGKRLQQQLCPSGGVRISPCHISSSLQALSASITALFSHSFTVSSHPP